MIQIVDHVGEKYLCPITQKTETILIQQTTTKPKLPEIRKGNSFAVTKDLEYCSGLDICGVMKDHEEGLAFQWELCPYRSIL
jgi:hypothetical protein